jgi:hypothetical protein
MRMRVELYSIRQNFEEVFQLEFTRVSKFRHFIFNQSRYYHINVF